MLVVAGRAEGGKGGGHNASLCSSQTSARFNTLGLNMSRPLQDQLSPPQSDVVGFSDHESEGSPSDLSTNAHILIVEHVTAYLSPRAGQADQEGLVVSS